MSTRRQTSLIDVRGLQQVDRALRAIDPDLRRQMYAEVGHLAKQRVEAAKADMPRASGALIKGTRLTKSGSKAAKAAGAGPARSRLFGFLALSSAPHARILDLAAQGRSKQGRNLVETLNARYGPAPRFLTRQFQGDLLMRESRQIVDRYIAEVNQRIEAASRAA